MRSPQSPSHPFVPRVFFRVTVALFLAVITLGAGAAAQQLTCTPSVLNFGNVVIGHPETEVAMVTNNGSTSVTISAMTASGTGFSAPGLTLPLTLSPGKSVSLNVNFSPTAVGYTQQGITLTSNASNKSLQLRLSGTGATSTSLGANPASVSFGQVALGATSTLPVVLTNTRTWTITLYGFQTVGTGFSASGLTLPMTLSPRQSVKMNLVFTPKSAGPSWGYILFSGPNVNLPISGTGTTTTSAGQLTIAPASLNFGNVNVGSTETQAITMSASGASVTVSSDASSSSQFVLKGVSLPFTIPAGQSSSFNVGFTPTASGTVSGSLSFTSNASSTKTVESLSGIGTTAQYSVSLSWNASSGVMGYNIYRSTSANGTYAKVNSALDANTAFTDNSVAAGQTYYYEATAVNSAGQESARSTPPVQASIP